jgi:hypothetical protein
MLEVIQCKKSDLEYKDIRDRHYVPNHGTIGRQLHYKIYLDKNLIGIITGASAVYACKARDEFFEINKENRQKIIQNIICNTVFRLEYHEKNLGTKILSVWRKQVAKDWFEKYHEVPIGFETFIYGENRFGAMYKADNWTYCGQTAGSAKFSCDAKFGDTGTAHSRVKTDIKLVFCKMINEKEIRQIKGA